MRLLRNMNDSNWNIQTFCCGSKLLGKFTSGGEVNDAEIRAVDIENACFTISQENMRCSSAGPGAWDRDKTLFVIGSGYIKLGDMIAN
jgi:hypothetical protein